MQILGKNNIFEQSSRFEFPTAYAQNNEAGSSVTVVIKLWSKRPKNRGSIPEIFFYNVQTSSGYQSATSALGIVGCSCPRDEDDHSLLSSAKVKNSWSSISNSPYVVHLCPSSSRQHGWSDAELWFRESMSLLCNQSCHLWKYSY
jgi:hypothetical protein